MRDTLKWVNKTIQSVEFRKKAIDDLIKITFDGAKAGFYFQYPGYNAQLAYERWTELIDFIDKVKDQTSEKDLIEYYDKQYQYIKAERDHLFSRYSNKIERDERLFKDIWDDIPQSRIDLDERLRQKYRGDSYFELAEQYFHCSPETTWKEVYMRMLDEQIRLHIDPRHKTVGSFETLLKRYRKKKQR